MQKAECLPNIAKGLDDLLLHLQSSPNGPQGVEILRRYMDSQISTDPSISPALHKALAGMLSLGQTILDEPKAASVMQEREPACDPANGVQYTKYAG